MSSKNVYRVVCKGGKLDNVFHINRLKCKKHKSLTEQYFLVDEQKGTITWTKYRSPLLNNNKVGYCRVKFKIIGDCLGYIRPNFIGLKCNKNTPSINDRVITAINDDKAWTQRMLVINDHFVILVTIGANMGLISVVYFQRIK